MTERIAPFHTVWPKRAADFCQYVRLSADGKNCTNISTDTIAKSQKRLLAFKFWEEPSILDVLCPSAAATLIFSVAKSQCGNLIIFSVTQILREINSRDSISAKSATLTQLEAEKFGFSWTCTFQRLKSNKSSSFRTSRFSNFDFT